MRELAFPIRLLARPPSFPALTILFAIPPSLPSLRPPTGPITFIIGPRPSCSAIGSRPAVFKPIIAAIFPANIAGYHGVTDATPSFTRKTIIIMKFHIIKNGAAINKKNDTHDEDELSSESTGSGSIFFSLGCIILNIFTISSADIPPYCRSFTICAFFSSV